MRFWAPSGLGIMNNIDINAFLAPQRLRDNEEYRYKCVSGPSGKPLLQGCLVPFADLALPEATFVGMPRAVCLLRPPQRQVSQGCLVRFHDFDLPKGDLSTQSREKHRF